MDEKAEALFNKALSRAMFYCSRAERCPADLYTKFSAWQLPEEYWDGLIDRLKEENFLSEERFVTAYVNDKIRYNKWGKRKLSYQLKAKGLSAAVILPAFDEFDQDEYLQMVESELTKKARTIKEPDNYKFKAKLYNFAAGRGYEPDLIERIIDNLIDNDDYS